MSTMGEVKLVATSCSFTASLPHAGTRDKNKAAKTMRPAVLWTASLERDRRENKADIKLFTRPNLGVSLGDNKELLPQRRRPPPSRFSAQIMFRTEHGLGSRQGTRCARPSGFADCCRTPDSSRRPELEEPAIPIGNRKSKISM